ncbi:MAG TPA: flagellar hook-length control protein FliK [Variovorax sp.]
MTSMITPPVMTNAASQTAAQAGARSRGADDDQGRSFGAALERSRATHNENRADAASQDGTPDVATIDRKTARKPGADEDTKEDGALPADPNLAFLAPLNTPLHALTLAGRSAQQQGSNDAADATAAATPVGAATDIPLDPALQAPAAKTLAGDAASVVADAKAAAPEAATKDSAAKPATPALPGTPAAPLQPDATQAASLHELARAAIAAQTMAVGFAKPASAPAGPPVGTAAAGRGAASRAPVSVTTAEQLAGAAQAKPPDDTQADKATPVAVTAAAAADNTDSQAPATPMALQQQAPVTASSSERANDTTAAARPSVHTIAPEVGSEKWAPALGQHLARMSTSGNHTAELNLNPAGLGPLKVTLSMGDNQAQAMFVSAHESVRKAIEAALPQLRNSLSEQGITLGQASVGSETRQPFSNDAAFAQQQSQQQQQQNAARQQAASTYPGAGRATASAPAAPLAAVRAGSPGNATSGVDTFA